MTEYKVGKLATAKESYDNCLVVSPEGFRGKSGAHFLQIVSGQPHQQHVFAFDVRNNLGGENPAATAADDEPQKIFIATNKLLRDWASLVVDETYPGKLVARADYAPLKRLSFTTEVYTKQPPEQRLQSLDTEQMHALVRAKFGLYEYAVTSGQPFVVKYEDISLVLHACELPEPTSVYRVDAATKISFQTTGTTSLTLNGKYKAGKLSTTATAKPVVAAAATAATATAAAPALQKQQSFDETGIGGLDEQLKEIQRRLVAPRNLPPDIVKKMGLRHVRGLLLHGPPGCGKTLSARHIARVLDSHEPLVASGPELLAGSGPNVARLFEPAEKEQRKMGVFSRLHVIIFDELDAICGRGGGGEHPAASAALGQLLEKMDGTEPLHNVLVVGITSRLELIDAALLRPGRFELQLEFGLPHELGRLVILKEHVRKMQQSRMLAADVDLKMLAYFTKNYSGAELSALVRAAQSSAIVRTVEPGATREVRGNADAIAVTMDDFLRAIETDVRPAHGSKEDDFRKYMTNGILIWDTSVQDILDNGELYNRQVQNSGKTPVVSVLLTGQCGSGKTALAVQMAINSAAPLIKVLSPHALVGLSELSKCREIKRVFEETACSKVGCVVVDDVERLIDYNPVGARYSHAVAQALTAMLKWPPPAGRRLLVIATSAAKNLLDQMGVTQLFGAHFHVPCLINEHQIMNVVRAIESNFSNKDVARIRSGLAKRDNVAIGVKHLIKVIGTAEQSDGDKSLTFLLTLDEDSKLHHRSSDYAASHHPYYAAAAGLPPGSPLGLKRGRLGSMGSNGSRDSQIFNELNIPPTT